MPAVIAPSPIIAIARFLDLVFFKPSEIPRAADIEVLECPAPNSSYGLSILLGNPDSPSFFLRVCILFFLPVKILWV